MKTISSNALSAAWACLILFAAALAFGMLWHWFFYVLSAAGLVGYVVIDKKYLRCPYCGGFENLERLSKARRARFFHCFHCGKEIEIR